MAYERRRGIGQNSGAANAFTALANATEQQREYGFDFDALVKNVNDFQKTRDAKEKADQEFQEKLADLDLKAQYYGIGHAKQVPNSNQIQIQPYPTPPAIPPIVAGQMAYAGFPLPPGSTQPGQPSTMIDPNDPIMQSIAQLPPKDQNIARRQVAVDAARQAQETKILSGEQIASVSNYASTIDQLENVIKDMGENKYKTGPVLAGGKYGFSDLPLSATIRARTFTPEETGFLSNARATMSDYLKAATGAQRGFKEINFLTPALPDPSSMTPDQFIKVGSEAVKRSRKNLTNILDFSRAGRYRNVDELAKVARIRGDQAESGSDFGTEEEAIQALNAGRIKSGDVISIGGKQKRVK